jgi:hypothetical protein
MTTDRPRTLSIKMAEVELQQAHACADATDESVGRWVRRLIAREYERLFGNATPPKVKFRRGPGKGGAK